MHVCTDVCMYVYIHVRLYVYMQNAILFLAPHVNPNQNYAARPSQELAVHEEEHVCMCAYVCIPAKINTLCSHKRLENA